jgi:hypothetical protein
VGSKKNEVVKIGTDWFVKVKCPKPNNSADSHIEHIKACSGCPYAIWKEPEMVAGFMASMCGVRVGSIGMAAELDEIAAKLSGIERFTKHESTATSKLGILEQVKSYVRKSDWKIEGLTREETSEHLDLLIEFCKTAEAKGLKIWAWA